MPKINRKKQCRCARRRPYSTDRTRKREKRHVLSASGPRVRAIKRLLFFSSETVLAQLWQWTEPTTCTSVVSSASSSNDRVESQSSYNTCPAPPRCSPEPMDMNEPTMSWSFVPNESSAGPNISPEPMDMNEPWVTPSGSVVSSSSSTIPRTTDSEESQSGRPNSRRVQFLPAHSEPTNEPEPTNLTSSSSSSSLASTADGSYTDETQSDST